MTASAAVHPEPFAVPLPAVHGAFLRRRATRTFRVAARRFAPLALRRARGREISETATATALRRTFEDLGATYMKFGQIVGSAPGVFGDEVAAAFRSCLDTGPSVPFDEVVRSIELDLGRRVEDAFDFLDPEPLAAASIAVVHRGRTHDGRDIVVKVLRPGIERIVAADLDLMRPLLELLSRQVGVGVAGTLLDTLNGLREQIAEELDLRNEARTMLHYRSLLAQVDLPLIEVPEPDLALSGRQTLTMTFLDGAPIDDLAAIERSGHDPVPRVEQLIQAWFLTALRNGVFHGDIHAGNLLLLHDGRVGVLDWGIVGRLDPTTHRFFRRVIEGALGDEAAWGDICDHIVAVYGAEAREMLGVDDDVFRTFVRGQLEPMLTKPFGEVSLSHLVMDPGTALRQDAAETAAPRRRRDIVREWRTNRARRHAAHAAGGIGSSSDRNMFLLGKQLLYFERYGKLFLTDRSILADEVFFRAVLAAEPLRP